MSSSPQTVRASASSSAQTKRAAVALHRQARERAVREEALDGDAMMRALVPQRADDPGLLVGLLPHPDSQLLAGPGEFAFADGEERGRDLPSVGERCLDPARLDVERGHFRRGQEPHARKLAGTGEQAAADRPVLDDEAQGLAADLAVIVAHAQGREALADHDVEDRLGGTLEMRPDATRLQQALPAPGDGGDAAVERGCRQR